MVPQTNTDKKRMFHLLKAASRWTSEAKTFGSFFNLWRAHQALGVDSPIMLSGKRYLFYLAFGAPAKLRRSTRATGKAALFQHWQGSLIPMRAGKPAASLRIGAERKLNCGGSTGACPYPLASHSLPLPPRTATGAEISQTIPAG